MAKRRTGFTVVEIVCLVLILLMLGGLAFFATKDGQPEVRTNISNVGANLDEGVLHFVPAHQESIQAYLMVDLQRGYNAWKNQVTQRLNGLKDIQAGKARELPPEKPGVSRIDRELEAALPIRDSSGKIVTNGMAAVRKPLELGRAMLYVHFALNGMRPIDELKNDPGKAGPIHGILNHGAIGSNLTELYNKLPESGGTAAFSLVGQRWSPLAGDPPDLEFTVNRVNAYLRGVDTALAELNSYRKDPSRPIPEEQKAAGDMFGDVKDTLKTNARRAVLELLLYEIKDLPDNANATKDVKALQEQLKALNEEFGKFCTGEGLTGLSATAADKALAADIKMAELEVKTAELLSAMAAKVQEVAMLKSRRQYDQAVEVIVQGREVPNPEGTGKIRVGGLAQLAGVADKDVKNAINKLLPVEENGWFSKTPSKADGTMTNLINKPGATVGHSAAVSVQILANIASRRAVDADMAITPQREQLIHDLAALEPAMQSLDGTIAKYKRDVLPTQAANEHNVTLPRGGNAAAIDGGIKLALQRVTDSLTKGELDAKGEPMLDAAGQPRKGLKDALAAATAEQDRLRNVLVALYERSEKLALPEREEFAKLKAQAEKIQQLSDAIAKEIAEKGKDAKPDFEGLLGSIRNPANRGEVGAFYDQWERHLAVAKLTYPGWYQRYIAQLEKLARRAAGEEPDESKEPPIPGEINLDGTPAEVSAAALLRDPAAIDAEIAGWDNAKAAKLAAMPAALRNLVLSHTSAYTMQAVMGKMGDAAKKVEEELDLTGVEKLIALQESALVFPDRKPGAVDLAALEKAFQTWVETKPPRPEAPAGVVQPTLAERKAAVATAIYPDVPVLTAKVAIAEERQKALEEMLSKQKAVAEESKKPIKEAAEELAKAVKKAVATSESLLKAEASVARLYDDAIMRYHTAACIAADKTERAWYRTVAHIERGNAMLTAAGFYLQQQRRLTLFSEAMARVQAFPEVEGVDGPLKAAGEAAVAHINAVRNVVAGGKPSAAVNVGSVDLGAYNPAAASAGKDELRQALPLARLMGYGDPATQGGQASLVLEAASELSLAKRYFEPEKKPQLRIPEEFSQGSRALPAEYFRVREEYVEAARWPLDVSLGTACAMAYRLTADPALTGAWTGGSLTEKNVMDAIPTDLRPQVPASDLSQLAAIFLQQGYINNLIRSRPEYRSNGIAALDAGDDAYSNNAPGFGPPLILKRIGWTDAVQNFRNRMGTLGARPVLGAGGASAPAPAPAPAPEMKAEEKKADEKKNQ